MPDPALSPFARRLLDVVGSGVLVGDDAAQLSALATALAAVRPPTLLIDSPNGRYLGWETRTQYDAARRLFALLFPAAPDVTQPFR